MKQLTILAFILMSSQLGYCQTSVAEFRYFSLKLDSTWHHVELKGIDSYVGTISNGVDTLSFDFGSKKYITGVRFFHILALGFNPEVKVRPTLINRQLGFIVEDKYEEKPIVSFHLIRLFKKNSLSFLWVYTNKESYKQIKRIVRTCKINNQAIRRS